MQKPIPPFTTDAEAEAFVATANLGRYDLSGARLIKFEMRPKAKTVTMRLPAALLKAVRTKAEEEGIPYQRFIRLVLGRAVGAVKS
jgi:predicted DNA binding CopG/RHH family protein